MSETIGVNVLRKAYNLEVSEQFNGYSGVRIYVGTDDDGNKIVYESGSTSGRVLEINNPFGTQELADNILRFDDQVYAEKVEAFLVDKGCAEDGNAARRVAHLIRDLLDGKPALNREEMDKALGIE